MEIGQTWQGGMLCAGMGPLARYSDDEMCTAHNHVHCVRVPHTGLRQRMPSFRIQEAEATIHNSFRNSSGECSELPKFNEFAAFCQL